MSMGYFPKKEKQVQHLQVGPINKILSSTTVDFILKRRYDMPFELLVPSPIC